MTKRRMFAAMDVHQPSIVEEGPKWPWQRRVRERTLAQLPFLAVAVLLAMPASARAGSWDLTLFLGQAFPTSNERFTIRLPAVPELPGLEFRAQGEPQLRPDGGLVLGGAFAWEVGVFGIEGRLDSSKLALAFTGARYDVQFTPVAPNATIIGTVSIGAGTFHADRLNIVSLNLRLRTPGPVSLMTSGGLSYLPDFATSGSVPIDARIDGMLSTHARLRLLVAPSESAHRVGVNGGAGLRLRVAGSVSLLAEARVFYFKSYTLRVQVEGVPGLIEGFLEDLEPVRFDPVIVNAVGGIVVSF